MNYYRKRPLLIGTAVLFAALGCAEPPPPRHGAGDVAHDASAPPSDTGSGADLGGPADSGGPVVDAADGGRPGFDSGTPPEDAAVPPMDAMAPDAEPLDAGPQHPREGQPCRSVGTAVCDRVTEMPELVCLGDRWTAVLGGWTAGELLCSVCSQPDGNGIRRSECGPVVVGERCFYRSAAVCNAENQPIHICQGNWTSEVNFCSPCQIDGRGVRTSTCAVPGFVGLDRAGRPRRAAQRLRQP